MKYLAAPLQGYTDAPWRHWHSILFGGVDEYYTPFLRVEKGEPCRRTCRDIESQLNENHIAIPQIIYRDADEFTLLSNLLRTRGAERIDINMGCPFPPQVRKGRGAGALLNIDELKRVAKLIEADTQVRYSVKMRLGVDDPDQWQSAAPILASIPLVHVTIHPRTARQQYAGELHMDSFEALAEAVGHPIVYNGELHTSEDIERIEKRYPWLCGVMSGRGLLARPELFVQYQNGEEWSEQKSIAGIMKLHDALFQYYTSVLCGDHQVLAKMKTYWEYSTGLIHRSNLKKINKARTLADYVAAVKGIL